MVDSSRSTVISSGRSELREAGGDISLAGQTLYPTAMRGPVSEHGMNDPGVILP